MLGLPTFADRNGQVQIKGVMRAISYRLPRTPLPLCAQAAQTAGQRRC
jgi:hypothetical protein